MVYRCFRRLRFFCPACFKLDSADTAFGYLYRLVGEKAAAEMVCEEVRIEFQAVAIFSFAYSKTEMAAAFLYIMKEMSLGHTMSHYGLFIFASLFYFLQICDKI